MNLYDVFICHAGEDKEEFVRPLASRLAQEHIEVWYDELSLRVGDSLRQSIDLGLARSRYGIVVLSPYFFEKQWPQRELDGLVARETLAGDRIILPIWHKITKETICEYSPPLADIFAVSSAKGLDEVVRSIVRVVRPQGSPLIVARERLLGFGVKVPVISDEWWLNVVEASSREPGWGFVPERPGWGRWTFPLPDDGGGPTERGERLAWTALQMQWEKEAETLRITQVSKPEAVRSFIRSQPGLEFMCLEHPQFLATYAPQLTIPGFAPEFEETFDRLLAESIARHEQLRRNSPTFGSALTRTKRPPVCDDYIALRHPTFGDYEPASVACQFVQGDIGGPPCKAYEAIDYLIWLLSDGSEWLPHRIRKYLIDGLRDWGIWHWSEHSAGSEIDLGLIPYPHLGSLQNEMFKTRRSKRFQLTKPCLADIRGRFEFSRRLLGLAEPTSKLMKRFLEGRFIDARIRRIRA